MSLEHLGCPYSPITQAISALHRGNVVVVVAAGNDNVDARSVTPACVPEAITVSAVVDTDGRCEGRGPTIEEYSTPSQSIYPRQIIRNPDDFIQSYSNYGSVVDLAAPAGRTLSTNNIGGYEPTGGTSAAAPHVAGAAALIKSLNPNGANPIFIDSFLKNTGTKAPPAGRPLISCDAAGRGYFDDRYGTTGVRVTTDTVKEPLLYMGAIR